MTNQQHSYFYYGTKTKASELVAFMEHLFQVNLKKEGLGHRKTPVCIWGRHGIGKTEIVEDFAQQHKYKFVYVAPAQFEEMGDLVGLPGLEAGKTVFHPPEWVPDKEGPGILLIDDANRADDRILRGIMQLLQNFELVSWKLPPKWQIVLTANPDGGDYSVTPMDDAMLTRMMHITLEFDVKEWAKWAEQHQIDPRGINFVLTYPEIVTGERTTPRTLVQFFEAISEIKDLAANLGLIQILGDACLDENTVSSFIAFVNQNLEKLISPEEILDADNFDRKVLAPIEKLVKKDALRVDILSTLATRMVNHLLLLPTDLKQHQVNNLKAFIKIDFIPNDIRLAMAQDMVASAKPSLQAILQDAEIGQLLLDRM